MLYVHEITPDGFTARKVAEVLCHKLTRYQQVTIVTHENLGRTLYLDGYFQSDDSFQTEYHEKMVNLASYASLIPIQNILICGSGPGGLEKACRKTYPTANIAPVELDSIAYALYREHVPDWGCNNAQTRFIDIFEFLPTLKDNTFDAVFWDLDADAVLGSGFGAFDHIKRILKADGAFVATAGSIQERAKNDPYKQLIRQLETVFPQGTLSALTRMNWNFFHARN